MVNASSYEAPWRNVTTLIKIDKTFGISERVSRKVQASKGVAHVQGQPTGLGHVS
jgi:hypothetical protein